MHLQELLSVVSRLPFAEVRKRCFSYTENYFWRLLLETTEKRVLTFIKKHDFSFWQKKDRYILDYMWPIGKSEKPGRGGGLSPPRPVILSTSSDFLADLGPYLIFTGTAAVSDGRLVTTTVGYRFCSFGLGRRQPTAVKTTSRSIGQPTASLVVWRHISATVRT